MSYIKPAVLIYQQLASSGGVANITPDLPAVLIGPCYNVIPFDTSNSSALSQSKAGTFNYIEGDPLYTVPPADLDVTLPSMIAGQNLLTSDLADIDTWFYNITIETFSEDTVVIATKVDATGVIITTTTDPTALDAGGVAKVQIGDDVYLGGDASSETLLSKVVGVSSTSVIISNVIGLTLATSLNFDLRITRRYTSIQATGGISTTTTQVDDIVTLTMPLVTTHGNLVGADVHIAYRAIRTDMEGTIWDFNNLTEAESKFGDMSDDNPLGLACSLALANTITGVRAVTTSTEDLAGYQTALTLLEGTTNAYALVPLTTSPSILAAVNAHAAAMSTPEEASWRISLINTTIPLSEAPGKSGGYSGGTVILDGSDYILEQVDGDFITDAYRAGDVMTIVDVDGTNSIDGDYIIDAVRNNNQITFVADPANISSDITFTVSRDLTKTEQASRVSVTSSGYNNFRVNHVQPDSVKVAINGVSKALPGYYLCAGIAGLIAGLPVQQGLTNISLAGFDDLEHSNFYFNRAQLNSMAEQGTALYTQLTPGSAPYCRHSLTTDMSTFQLSLE